MRRFLSLSILHLWLLTSYPPLGNLAHFVSKLCKQICDVSVCLVWYSLHYTENPVSMGRRHKIKELGESSIQALLFRCSSIGACWEWGVLRCRLDRCIPHTSWGNTPHRCLLGMWGVLRCPGGRISLYPVFHNSSLTTYFPLHCLLCSCLPRFVNSCLTYTLYNVFVCNTSVLYKSCVFWSNEFMKAKIVFSLLRASHSHNFTAFEI